MKHLLKVHKITEQGFASNWLKEDIIEAIECLKSWAKAGVIVFPEAVEVDGILEHLKKGYALGSWFVLGAYR